MAVETERKFLVNALWTPRGDAKPYRQAYLAEKGCTLRIRRVGEQCFLTVKGAARGCSRLEFEYEVPYEDAEAMFTLALYPPIEKIRYRVPGPDGRIWEVDEFHGANEGLVVAEIELESEDEPFVKPDWVGEEVTYDKRYTNVALSREPYSRWL